MDIYSFIRTTTLFSGELLPATESSMASTPNEKPKKNTMKFSDKERDKIDRFYKEIRDHLEFTHQIPECVHLTPAHEKVFPGVTRYVWKRHEMLLAMSKDELTALIEADTVIFGIPLAEDWSDTKKPLFDTNEEFQEEILACFEKFGNCPDGKKQSEEEYDLYKQEEQRIRYKWRYKRYRIRFEILKRRPELLPIATDEDPIIWDRFHELCAMSYDELMEEIIADDVLFGLIKGRFSIAEQREEDEPLSPRQWADWVADISRLLSGEQVDQITGEPDSAESSPVSKPEP